MTTHVLRWKNEKTSYDINSMLDLPGTSQVISDATRIDSRFVSHLQYG